MKCGTPSAHKLTRTAHHTTNASTVSQQLSMGTSTWQCTVRHCARRQGAAARRWARATSALLANSLHHQLQALHALLARVIVRRRTLARWLARQHCTRAAPACGRWRRRMHVCLRVEAQPTPTAEHSCRHTRSRRSEQTVGACRHGARIGTALACPQPARQRGTRRRHSTGCRRVRRHRELGTICRRWMHACLLAEDRLRKLHRDARAAPCGCHGRLAEECPYLWAHSGLRLCCTSTIVALLAHCTDT